MKKHQNSEIKLRKLTSAASLHSNFPRMFKIFRPQYRLLSVLELTPHWLKDHGIASLLLDVDSTVKQYLKPAPEPEVMSWLEEMKQANIGLCLVSNGRGRRIGKFAESIDVPFVAPAMKPLAIGCRKAIKKMNFDPSTTAMVGDQIFADVVAANLMGITSILVKPIRPDLEPLWTRIKRPLEAILLKQE